NLLVSLGSGMTTPVATFLHYLLLPTLVNLLIGGWYLRRTLGARLDTGGAPSAPRPPKVPLLPSSGFLNSIRRFPVLVLFPVTMTGMVTVDVAANLLRGAPVPLYAIALGGAVLVLLVTPGRGELFARADWTILVLFAALFVVVAGAETGGLLAGLQAVQPIPGPGHRLSSIGVILATGLVGSQLVSNVPWVALQIPVLHAAGYGPSNPWAWVALAGGSTLAGNLTLLGAASNLIVVQQSERAGIRIGLTQFVRIGLPITALTVLVLYVFLAIGW
ncbi:MAG TPA: SLC13 family permease, partial [Thermoplasmata archaeon]|nr:SLC13 family permease [Thermoplasmata archaeon]